VPEPWLGQPLLVVALCVGIIARRYGRTVRQAGRLVALPFLALLITPAPSLPEAHAVAILWAPVVAPIAVVWSSAAESAKARLLPLSPRPLEPQRAPRRNRWDAPTRMAIQMAVALGSAFVLGHLFFGDRWAWTVLSAYLVASGNRGRGDVVHKAGLRVLGAALGTVVASIAAGGLTPGNRWLLVALFVVMGVALVLRERSYAFWAGGVTAMVALLHGYYGESGTSVLGERLLGVLIGSALGVAAAWFVLPVRTADVLRRRLADCLAALTDDLGDGAGTVRTMEPLARLDDLAHTLRAHHRTLGRRNPTAAATAIPAMRALAAEAAVASDADRRRLRRDFVRVRRAIVGKDDPSPSELPVALAKIHAVLEATQR
jgi:uncharacterized membrane protein YccC